MAPAFCAAVSANNSALSFILEALFNAFSANSLAEGTSIFGIFGILGILGIVGIFGPLLLSFLHKSPSFFNLALPRSINFLLYSPFQKSLVICTKTFSVGGGGGLPGGGGLGSSPTSHACVLHAFFASSHGLPPFIGGVVICLFIIPPPQVLLHGPQGPISQSTVLTGALI